jgi:hypothetical protein
MFGPYHISAMKIGGICRISVKLIEWSNVAALRSPALPGWSLAALPYPGVTARSDNGEKLGRLRVDAPCS